MTKRQTVVQHHLSRPEGLRLESDLGGSGEHVGKVRRSPRNRLALKATLKGSNLTPRANPSPLGVYPLAPSQLTGERRWHMDTA